MQMSHPKISVKNLLNLLNLLRGYKSTCYKPKTLNTLNKFNKTPLLLIFVNVILLRVLRDNYLRYNKLSRFNASTFFWSLFQKVGV